MADRISESSGSNGSTFALPAGWNRRGRVAGFAVAGLVTKVPASLGAWARLAGHFTRFRAFFMALLIASVGSPLRFNSIERKAVPLNA